MSIEQIAQEIFNLDHEQCASLLRYMGEHYPEAAWFEVLAEFCNQAYNNKRATQ